MTRLLVRHGRRVVATQIHESPPATAGGAALHPAGEETLCHRLQAHGRTGLRGRWRFTSARCQSGLRTVLRLATPKIVWAPPARPSSATDFARNAHWTQWSGRAVPSPGLKSDLEGACTSAPGKRKLRTVLMAGTALGDEGAVGGAIVILQNITEQKRVEAELRRSEEKFRSLVENLPDVIWRADRQGRILFVSSNCQAILGLGCRRAAGSDRFARVHPEDLPELRRAYAQLIKHGQPYDVRYRFQRGDETWVWLHERAAATSESAGGSLCRRALLGHHRVRQCRGGTGRVSVLAGGDGRRADRGIEQHQP